MIEEKEPLYFKEFRNLVIKKFDSMDRKFDSIDDRFNKLEVKIEKDVGDLALATAEEFRRVHERLNELDDRFDNIKYDMAEIREYNRLIEQHIGRYEVRATTFEEILLQDFKPRILALEKLA